MRPNEETEGGEKRGNLGGRERTRGGTGAGPSGGGGTFSNGVPNTADWRGWSSGLWSPTLGRLSEAFGGVWGWELGSSPSTA